MGQEHKTDIERLSSQKEAIGSIFYTRAYCISLWSNVDSCLQTHIWFPPPIPPINAIEPYSIFFFFNITQDWVMSTGPKFTLCYDFVQEHSRIILLNVWLSLFTGFNPNRLCVALLQPGNYCPKSLHPWSRWVCLDINEKQYWTDTNNSTDTCLKIFSISIEKLVHTFGNKCVLDY